LADFACIIRDLAIKRTDLEVIGQSSVMPHNPRSTWFVFASCLVVGCARDDPPEKKMPSQPEQKITALTDADQQQLRDQRAVVEKYLGNEDSKQKYKTAVGKLGTIRAILQAGVFKPEQTYELQCLGVILGDAFVQEMGMEWIMVEDEHGRHPAIRLPKTTIILYPLTMISKRMERGEKVDVFELFNGVAAQVEDIQRQAK
jgi:Domain of unknown function (DUF3806)